MLQVGGGGLRAPGWNCNCPAVMFKWNVLLDLSGEAATKTFGSLMTELLLQILSQSTRAMTVWMIHGDEGVGDIPGIRGVQGGL